MKTYMVIGLGRFGSSLAVELCVQGNEVLGIDQSPELVQQYADRLTHAVCADANDPAVLKSLGAVNYDCAVVAMGDDIASSVLITLSLKELGVPKVICKASSHAHQRVLEKVGADRVVFPEYEMGVKLAQGLSHSDILNYIELSNDYSIVEVELPALWRGKTIRELDVRAKLGVNIIAVRSGADGTLNVAPGGDRLLADNDKLVVLGTDANINRIYGK